MKFLRLSFLLVLLMSLASSAVLAEEATDAKSDANTEAKAYGETVSDAEIVPISKLYAAPDEFVGETVKVSGRILSVCAKRGCWMELASDKEFETLRIKVEDGVMVFPLKAVGSEAIAEGVFTKIELTLEQTQMMEKHKCEKKGEKYDPSKTCTPGTLYQLAGTGAVIQ